MMRVGPILVLLLLQNWKAPNEIRPSSSSPHNKFGVVWTSKQRDPDWRWRFSVDYQFISRTLWPELLKITGADPGLRIPKISLSTGMPVANKMPVFGEYVLAKQEVRVYYFNIYSFIAEWNWNRGVKLSVRECDVQLYSVITHELLHYILHMKGISSENQNHHHLMYEGGISRQANIFITLHFRSSGLAYASDMSYLRERNQEYFRIAKANKSSP